MSSKGRGPSLGGPSEFYPTPASVTQQLFKTSPWLAVDGLWLDPCVGDGALVRDAAPFLKNATWDVCDLLSEDLLAPNFGGAHIRQAYFGKTFLTHAPTNRQYVSALINPPFSQWTNFVERALLMSDRVIVLGAMTVFGSTLRLEWWRHMQKYLVLEHVIVPRPRFRMKCSDSVDYEWIVFDRKPKRPFAKVWPT